MREWEKNNGKNPLPTAKNHELLIKFNVSCSLFVKKKVFISTEKTEKNMQNPIHLRFLRIVCLISSIVQLCFTIFLSFFFFFFFYKFTICALMRWFEMYISLIFFFRVQHNICTQHTFIDFLAIRCAFRCCCCCCTFLVQRALYARRVEEWECKWANETVKMDAKDKAKYKCNVCKLSRHQYIDWRGVHLEILFMLLCALSLSLRAHLSLSLATCKCLLSSPFDFSYSICIYIFIMSYI